MILSDRTIRALVESGELGIDPWEPRNLQPASVDVRLSSLYIGKAGVTYDIGKGLTLPPDAFCLCSTVERVAIPDNIVARIEGKSSLGRVGLAVHITAGFIDPGFTGTLTLEVKNLGHQHIEIRPGQLIAQLSFMRLDRPVERPYGSVGLGSQYQGQIGPTASTRGAWQ